MKKIITLIILISGLAARAFMPPDIGTIHNHNMQMLEQQRFRMEVINDYKTVQEEKERYRKNTEQQKPRIKQITQPENSKLINENGEIKIKY